MERAYQVLLRAMQEAQRAAVVTFVMSLRQQYAFLRADGDKFALLYYGDEVRELETEWKQPKPDEREVAFAGQYINHQGQGRGRGGRAARGPEAASEGHQLDGCAAAVGGGGSEAAGEGKGSPVSSATSADAGNHGPKAEEGRVAGQFASVNKSPGLHRPWSLL
jgi:hypothetical protein